VQITRFGGPEGLDVVDVPESEAGAGPKLYDVSTAAVDYSDTHHRQAPQAGALIGRLGRRGGGDRMGGVAGVVSISHGDAVCPR
jgi:hypothetical protein